MKRLADFRPVDRLPTIRAKLGSITVFAVAVTIMSLYVLVGFALRDSEHELAFRQSLKSAHDLATQAIGPNGAAAPELPAAAGRAGRFALVADAQGKVLQQSMPLPPTVAKVLAGSVDSGVTAGIEYVGVPVVRDGAVVGPCTSAHPRLRASTPSRQRPGCCGGSGGSSWWRGWPRPPSPCSAPASWPGA
ncbi:MAG: hypothetical protein NVSMB32_10270 [Actinomycetota bacterium]